MSKIEDEARIQHIQHMRSELRRGGLVMAVLEALRRKHYGFSLHKRLHEVDIDIEEGTLYPLIRRLEGQGLLHSEWSEREGRKRRYYEISKEGLWVLEQLHREWGQMVESMQQLKGGAT